MKIIIESIAEISKDKIDEHEQEEHRQVVHDACESQKPRRIQKLQLETRLDHSL